MDLSLEIEKLLELKQEGGYWDFKREWYTRGAKDGDLLHDIICLANNLENHDAYIIIGIENETWNVLGISSDDVNRKNTQKLVDFLKDKKFAGGIRPTVKVQTIKIDNKEVDVIVIKNTTNTPYYLTQGFKGLFANNIYTRIQDTNTSKDRSADIDKVELLWKKRFGLLSPPIEKLEIYLKDYSNWINGPHGEMEKYYKYFPEYTLRYNFDESRTAYEYYMFFQIDKTPRYLSMRFYYHQTLLKELIGISLDGGRYITPIPSCDGIALRDDDDWVWDIKFRYMEENSFEFSFNKFLYNKQSYENYRYIRARFNFLRSVLIFKDKKERDDFKEYVKLYWDIGRAKYEDKKEIPSIPKIDGYNSDDFEKECINILILQNMLKDFRDTL